MDSGRIKLYLLLGYYDAFYRHLIVIYARIKNMMRDMWICISKMLPFARNKE